MKASPRVCEMDYESEAKKEMDAVEEAASINGKELSPSDPEISFENDATLSQEQLEVDNKISIGALDVSETYLQDEVHCEIHRALDATTGGANFEMDQKTSIKEEVDMFNKYSLNEKELGSTDHKSYYEINSTRRGEVELDNNIIKEEMDISDTTLPNEGACFPTDFEKRLNNDSMTTDFKVDNNAELKGWTCLSNVSHEQKYFSGYIIKGIKKESVTISEKKEANVGGMSTETVCQLKVPTMNILKWNENMDEKREEFELAASSRLCVQTVCAEIQQKDTESLQRTKSVDSGQAKKFGTDKAYSNVQALNNNMRLQHKITGKIFSGKSVMKLQDIINEKINPHTCYISQKNFSLLQASKNQKLIGKDKQTHECNFCNKRFTRLYSLKMHSLIHKGEKPHECHVCNKKFTRRCDLNRHNLIHKDEQPHECEVCNKRYARLSGLNRHTLIHKEPYECNVCNKRFAALSNLRNHSFMHKGEKPHECNVCNKRFAQLSNLKTHSLIHKGERPHECNVCNKSFTLLGNLKSHILIHTGEKLHECNVCNKRYTRLSSLKNHSLIHKGEKPHVCKICSKRFTWLSNLKEHILIHKGEKPHECKVCHKRFTQQASLINHSRIHKGGKPFECNICSKRFTRQARLNHHTLIHKGEKSLECSVYNKRFNKLSTLNTKSLISKNSEKSHECNVCKKKFTRLSSMKIHCLIHQHEKAP